MVISSLSAYFVVSEPLITLNSLIFLLCAKFRTYFIKVEKGERGVDRALIAVGEAELVLARGVRRRQKERVVLPLYLPLASSLEESDFSAPLLTVVSAMVPSFCGLPLSFLNFTSIPFIRSAVFYIRVWSALISSFFASSKSVKT